MALERGSRLGPYEILDPVGKGGMGEVYRANDTRLGRDVAVKVLPEVLAHDPERLARFQREARLLASLNHPNIVTVYSVEEAAGVPFLVMELLEGRPLAELIPDEGLPLERLLDIAVPLADAVAAAHGRGVIHRDIKPANVMVSETGQVKVVDFGVAKGGPPAAADEAATAAPTRGPVERPITAAGGVVGTLKYMAPEQARGRAVDGRADVFSLGVLLYEMATGHKAFTGASPSDLLSSLLRDEPTPVSELRPHLPGHLAWLIRRCLEKDPERRIQTCADVRNELEEVRRASPLGGPGLRGGQGERRGSAPAERRFVLTTDLVRRLSEKSPRFIGRAMTYLDNGADSPTLVVLVHGMGADQRQFDHVLDLLPERAVAPTLVGFEAEASFRPSLGVEDHSQILRAFLWDLGERLKPSSTILVGFSSGADQCLRLASASRGADIPISALVAMGPNVELSTCFISRRFAALDAGNPAGALALLKELGRDITSLSDWLTLQGYVVPAFSKLSADLGVLKRYASSIIEPFESSGDPLAEWFRGAAERIPHVRMVFGSTEATEAEGLLARHLEHDVLGPRFSETSFVIETVHHMNLVDPQVLLAHIREAVRAVAKA